MALLNAEQTKAKHEKDRADKAAIIRREADEEKVRKAFGEGKASTESHKAPMADTTGNQGAQGKVRESWADETKRKAGIKKEAEEIKKAKAEGKEPVKQEEKKEEKPVQDDSPILDRSNIVLPPEPEPFPAAPVAPAPAVPVAPAPVLPQIKSKDQRSAELESDILDMKRSIDELKDAIDTQKADNMDKSIILGVPDGVNEQDMLYWSNVNHEWNTCLLDTFGGQSINVYDTGGGSPSLQIAGWVNASTTAAVIQYVITQDVAGAVKYVQLTEFKAWLGI